MPLIKEQIKKLLELQKFDLKIIGLEKEKKHLPKMIEQLCVEAGKINEQISKADGELKEVQLARKNKELELQVKEAEIKKYKAQLFQIKSNKEYSALLSEINKIKADNSVLEDEIINLLDKIDAIDEKVKQEREKLQIKNSRIKEEEKKVEERIGRIAVEIEEAEKEKEKVLLGVEKSLYRKYEKVLRGKNGAALVPVAGHCCGGCNLELPPQVIEDINSSGDLICCENCARILFLSDSTACER